MELVIEKHIDQSPGIRGGKAHIKNTRITVSDMVIMHLRLGQSLEEIAATYDLSLSAVYAAMAYYYDHNTDIDAEIEIERQFYEEMRQKSPSLLKERLFNKRNE